MTNSTLIPIASVVNQDIIKTQATSIGIVFPAYLAQLYGVPLIVERFVEKLENLNSKYIFAVCTCGGFELVNALPTLKNLSRLIKSLRGKLTAEFSIKLPMNNLDYPSKLINQNHEKMFKNAKEKIHIICKVISRKKKNRYKALKTVFNLFMRPTYYLLKNFYISHLERMSHKTKDTKLNFRQMIRLSDKSITVNESCNGCGTCVKVCPVHNIVLVDNQPTWQHHCEMCLACDEWCPTDAIHHWCKTKGKDYHHPEVTLSNIKEQSVPPIRVFTK